MKNNFTLITTFSIIVLMVTTVSDGYTNLCEVGTLRYSVLTEREESVLSLAFHPDPDHSNILAVGRSKITEASDDTIKYDGTIELWNTSTGKLLHTLWGHADAVFALAFSPDGKTLASGSADGTVRIWNTTDIENQKSVEELWKFSEHNGLVLTLAFLTENGNVLASGSNNGSIRYWNLKTGEWQDVIYGDALPAVFSLASSPERKLLGTGRADNIIRVWNFEDGTLMHTFEGHGDPVTSLAFDAHGNMLVSGSADGTVKLWDIGTSAPPQEFTPSSDWVNSVALHGTTLASANFNGAIFLWDIDTKKRLYTLTGHSGSVESIAFSSDGKTIASGGHDGKVLLWDLTPPRSEIEGDVNGDGFVNLKDLEEVDARLGETGENTADVDGDSVVNIADLVMIAKIMADVNGDKIVDFEDLEEVNTQIGKKGKNAADINADGIVNIADLVMVANALCPMAAAAPSAYKYAEASLTAEQVQQWLTEARLLEETSVIYQRGILALEQLLAMLTPKQTALLPNYPNPFNPETWIPYQLAADADVTVSIYAVDGSLVRTLELGHQVAGNYQTKHRAAYWDGHNNLGERVASGVYFYTLTAGNFTTTRKMLVRK